MRPIVIGALGLGTAVAVATSALAIARRDDDDADAAPRRPADTPFDRYGTPPYDATETEVRAWVREHIDFATHELDRSLRAHRAGNTAAARRLLEDGASDLTSAIDTERYHGNRRIDVDHSAADRRRATAVRTVLGIDGSVEAVIDRTARAAKESATQAFAKVQRGQNVAAVHDARRASEQVDTANLLRYAVPEARRHDLAADPTLSAAGTLGEFVYAQALARAGATVADAENELARAAGQAGNATQATRHAAEAMSGTMWAVIGGTPGGFWESYGESDERADANHYTGLGLDGEAMIALQRATARSVEKTVDRTVSTREHLQASVPGYRAVDVESTQGGHQVKGWLREDHPQFAQLLVEE